MSAQDKESCAKLQIFLHIILFFEKKNQKSWIFKKKALKFRRNEEDFSDNVLNNLSRIRKSEICE